MAYCPNCGSAVAEAARFCSNCAQPLTTEASPQPPEVTHPPLPPAVELSIAPSKTLGLDDIPVWIGWLGIPMVVSLIGFPMYCFWAYRRGRSDGVGRDPDDPPYSHFGWRVAGWAILTPIIIVGWYVAVHLPTLCYKHGLRVGAKEGTAPQSFTSLPAVLGAASASLVAVIVGIAVISLASGDFESGDDGSVSPAQAAPTARPVRATARPVRATPSGPRLTGAEAAGKVENLLRQSIAESGRRDLSYACDPEDFNDVTQKWIVACLVVGPQNSTSIRFTVDDRTGTVEAP